MICDRPLVPMPLSHLNFERSTSRKQTGAWATRRTLNNQSWPSREIAWWMGRGKKSWPWELFFHSSRKQTANPGFFKGKEGNTVCVCHCISLFKCTSERWIPSLCSCVPPINCSPAGRDFFSSFFSILTLMSISRREQTKNYSILSIMKKFLAFVWLAEWTVEWFFAMSRRLI